MSPSGTPHPSAAATRSLPSATPAVEKSTTSGPSGPPGAAQANGFGAQRPPVPPNGATTAPELQNAIPIRPRVGQLRDVLAEPPHVIAVTDGHGRDPVRAGRPDRQPSGQLRSRLPEALTPTNCGNAAAARPSSSGVSSVFPCGGL
jgi:hypothetical protein